MKWNARIIVFTIALVTGTFAASMFLERSQPEAIPVDEVPLGANAPSGPIRTPITENSLIGSWKGTWDHDDGGCTIEIDRAEGGNFQGTLKKGGAVVLFEGTFDPKTRMLKFNETKIVSLGTYSEWSLGKNVGFISPDGRTLVGSGRDKWGWYGWAVSSY